MKFITANFSAMKKKLAQVFVAGCLMATPFLAIAGPGEPGGGAAAAGGPDGVPFDINMNLIFLTVGVLFAGFVIAGKFSKKTTKA
jgi:hypothetical protein